MNAQRAVWSLSDPSSRGVLFWGDVLILAAVTLLGCLHLFTMGLAWPSYPTQNGLPGLVSSALLALLCLCCLFEIVWLKTAHGINSPRWLVPTLVTVFGITRVWAHEDAAFVWVLCGTLLLHARIPMRLAQLIGFVAVALSLWIILKHGGAAADALAPYALAGIFVVVVMSNHLHASEKTRIELQETSGLLQDTLNNMGQGIIFFDSQSRVRMFNHQACELLDLPSELLETRLSLADLVSYQTQRGDFGANLPELNEQARLFVKRAKDNEGFGLPVRVIRPTRQGRYLPDREPSYAHRGGHSDLHRHHRVRARPSATQHHS
jgi:PAS domain-containing protein